VTALVTVLPGADTVAPSVGPLENRFHFATVAFLRAKQLQAGARPRVVPHGRQKPVALAIREVLADTVSWSIEEVVKGA
jgi:DNA-directed RNA polymerase omega subunit